MKSIHSIIFVYYKACSDLNTVIIHAMFLLAAAISKTSLSSSSSSNSVKPMDLAVRSVVYLSVISHDRVAISLRVSHGCKTLFLNMNLLTQPQPQRVFDQATCQRLT